MDLVKHTSHYDIAEIEIRARQLRAEATAHGVKVALAWVSRQWAALWHRPAQRSA